MGAGGVGREEAEGGGGAIERGAGFRSIIDGKARNAGRERDK